MAHEKAGGSTRNGRTSNPQYRGIKVYGGEKVLAGSIIVRQVGSSFHPGENVKMAKDYSLFALCEGVVKYEHGRNKRKLVSVYPA